MPFLDCLQAPRLLALRPNRWSRQVEPAAPSSFQPKGSRPAGAGLRARVVAYRDREPMLTHRTTSFRIESADATYTD